jgi:hypothetical protein
MEGVMGCEICDPDLLFIEDLELNPCQCGAMTACWDCGREVPVEDLWVGTTTGTALCKDCFDRWVRAGRARRTGEF